MVYTISENALVTENLEKWPIFKPENGHLLAKVAIFRSFCEQHPRTLDNSLVQERSQHNISKTLDHLTRLAVSSSVAKSPTLRVNLISSPVILPV